MGAMLTLEPLHHERTRVGDRFKMLLRNPINGVLFGPRITIPTPHPVNVVTIPM